MPGEGFEPPTFGLQNRCTTTVLTRPGEPDSTSEQAGNKPDRLECPIGSNDGRTGRARSIVLIWLPLS
jgi:hypothetical protein